MTKTISFELSKRLDELGLLRDVETEYIYQEGIKSTIGKGGAITFSGDGIFKIKSIKELYKGGYIFYKTLTTDEAIEFLPSKIYDYTLHILKSYPCKAGKYFSYYENIDGKLLGNKFLGGKTLIESIEYLITYLLDNNLIGQTELN